MFSEKSLLLKSTEVTPFVGVVVDLPTFTTGWHYIETRENTSDDASVINIEQTVSGAELRLHQPIDQSVVKMVVVNNTGSESFLFKGHGALSNSGGTRVAAGTGIIIMWTGSTAGYVLVAQGTAVLP